MSHPFGRLRAGSRAKNAQGWDTRRFFGSEVKVKIKVKGNGQECPFYTGKFKGNINVKGQRCALLCVPPLRQAQGRLLRKERARMGHPRRFFGLEIKVKIKVKGNREELSHLHVRGCKLEG